jgi:hypothetical protein
MNDIELLFLVLAVVYAIECAAWMKPGSVAFRSWLGKRFQIVQPSTVLANARGGIVFAHPLPPLGFLLAGHPMLLCFSPAAALACVPSFSAWPAQTGRLVRFEELKTAVASGRKVIVNGELLLKAPSPTLARHLAKTLMQLAGLGLAAREAALRRMVADSFDSSALQKRWAAFQAPAARIKALANGLFVYLFVLAPILISRLGLSGTWLWLLSGALALTLPTALCFRAGHKKLYPDAADERFTHFLTILLSPATTLRAHDILARPLLEGFHLLAIAKVFCSSDRFTGFASQIVRQLRHTARPQDRPENTAAREVESWARSLAVRSAEDFLTQNGLNPEVLAGPPAPADPTCRSYCPRCLAQFTKEEGQCADCGGLALEPLVVRARGEVGEGGDGRGRGRGKTEIRSKGK